MSNNNAGKKLGIICGGGPAPGINTVISSVAIAALKRGFDEVIGFNQGFKWLSEGDANHYENLTISKMTKIFNKGGVYLVTSRANPCGDDRKLDNCVKVFRQLGITHLVTIGGEDTAFSSMTVADHARKQGYEVHTVHVPKTIDNDLPLPEGVPTFGFETARAMGTQIATAIQEDARSTNRWYVVVCMGRKSGYLTLGIGKSSAATVNLIPEEFDMKCSEHLLVDTIVGSVFKRMTQGKEYGTAVVAEGFLELDGFFEGIEDVKKDDHGHPILSEIHFSGHLKGKVEKRVQQFGYPKFRVVHKDIGYELRCTDPIPFDVEYCRNLGWAAIDFLVNDGSHSMITIQNEQLTPIPFNKMFDPKTGKVRIRTVDRSLAYFHVARDFQVRLTLEDFENEDQLRKLADVANTTPENFKKEFYHVVEWEKYAPRDERKAVLTGVEGARIE
jgi:ATP-dependent phosphofructokinase / diphosphate-dependent phosphofructokinase